MAEALLKSLRQEMNEAVLGEVELVEEVYPDYPNPVLVVEVAKPGLFWTPFYATSRLPVQAGYASNGDTTFVMGETPVTDNRIDGQTLNMYAEYTVSDCSWGLISRLGYYQLRADYLAKDIVASTMELYLR